MDGPVGEWYLTRMVLQVSGITGGWYHRWVMLLVEVSYVGGITGEVNEDSLFFYYRL